jgi:hypothetical protein
MRYSPKYARDGAKMVRCALDQSSKVRGLIRCANYMYALGCQASGEILYSPKNARDGAKIVRCALDQSSKVRDLIRCTNYIYILWVVKHRAQCYRSGAKLFSVNRTGEMATETQRHRAERERGIPDNLFFSFPLCLCVSVAKQASECCLSWFSQPTPPTNLQSQTENPRAFTVAPNNPGGRRAL